MVGFQNCPYLFYYKHTSDSFELVWKKSIKSSFLERVLNPLAHTEHDFDCYKYTAPCGVIFLQTSIDEVCMYDQQLSLIRKLRAPGWMIGLLHGAAYAVVTNEASPGIPTKLSVVSVVDMGAVHHNLDTPPEGEYGESDVLLTCGHEWSGVAVIVFGEPFVDLYGPEGDFFF